MVPGVPRARVRIGWELQRFDRGNDVVACLDVGFKKVQKHPSTVRAERGYHAEISHREAAHQKFLLGLDFQCRTRRLVQYWKLRLWRRVVMVDQPVQHPVADYTVGCFVPQPGPPVRKHRRMWKEEVGPMLPSAGITRHAVVDHESGDQLIVGQRN